MTSLLKGVGLLGLGGVLKAMYFLKRLALDLILLLGFYCAFALQMLRRRRVGSHDSGQPARMGR